MDQYNDGEDGIKNNWNDIRQNLKDTTGQDPGDYSIAHVNRVNGNAAKAVRTAPFLQELGITQTKTQSAEKIASGQQAVEAQIGNLNYKAAMAHMDPQMARIVGLLPPDQQAAMAKLWMQKTFFGSAMGGPDTQMYKLAAFTARTEAIKMPDSDPRKKQLLEEAAKMEEAAQQSVGNTGFQQPNYPPKAAGAAPAAKMPPPGPGTYNGVHGTWTGTTFVPDKAQ